MEELVCRRWQWRLCQMESGELGLITVRLETEGR
jgi:hypothetical protein